MSPITAIGSAVLIALSVAVAARPAAGDDVMAASEGAAPPSAQVGLPCEGTDSTRYPLRGTVYNTGMSLRSDGRGAYVDGADNVGVYSKFAINIATSYFGPSRRRALTFDLSRPVPGSGAVNRRTISDAAGRCHAFATHESSTATSLSPTDMAIGVPYLADRVEANIHAKGRTYYLQFGPFYMGQCAQANGVVVPNAGDGTTPGTLTRTSATTWRVMSPAGSVGRLWDITDPHYPADLGLYYFDYQVDWEAQ